MLILLVSPVALCVQCAAVNTTCGRTKAPPQWTSINLRTSATWCGWLDISTAVPCVIRFVRRWKSWSSPGNNVNKFIMHFFLQGIHSSISFNIFMKDIMFILWNSWTSSTITLHFYPVDSFVFLPINVLMNASQDFDKHIILNVLTHW